MEVSVIVPVLNENEKAIQTIVSLKKQNFKDYEIIVVDSSDNETYLMLKRIKGIKLFHIPKKGIANARNYGLKKSKGKIIVFLDSGFVVKKDWLRKIKKELEKSNSSGIGGSFFSGRKNWISKFHFQDRKFRLGNKRKYVDMLATNNAAFYKKDLIAVCYTMQVKIRRK